MYRIRRGILEIFLVHPGGPYFANQQFKCWSIPKGETTPDEDLLECAKREFFEETGIVLAKEKYLALGALAAKGNKIIHIWAFKKNFTGKIVSNTFHLVWPPNGTVEVEFPEIDDGKYFNVLEARHRIFPSQQFFIDRLMRQLGRDEKIEIERIRLLQAKQ